MKTSFALVALAAATIIGGSALAPSAFAQAVPEGQSCGGLLCDMGVFGHKTAPTPAPAPAAPVVEKRAEAPAARDGTAEPAEALPRKRTAQRKKRIAKAKPAAEVATAPEPQVPRIPATRAANRVAPTPSLSAMPAYAPPPATAGETPTFAATSTMDPAPVVAPAPAAVPRPAVAAVPTRPAPSEARPTAILDPFGQTPVTAPFRSLY